MTAPVIEPDAPDVPVDGPAAVPWNAVLAVEGQPNSNGYQFSPGALMWRALPMTLSFQFGSQPEHDGAIPVGRIDTITRDGALIRAAGVFAAHDPADPSDQIAKAVALIGDRVQCGISIEHGDTVVEMAADEDEISTVTQGTIMKVAVVSPPAVAEAVIALGVDPVQPNLAFDPSSGSPTVTAAVGDPAPDMPADPAADMVAVADGTMVAVGDDVLAIVDGDGGPRPVDGVASAVDVDAATVDVTAEDGTVYPAVPAASVWADPDDAADEQAEGEPAAESSAAPAPVVASAQPIGVLLASAGKSRDWIPPRDWFNDPQFGANPTDDPRLGEVLDGKGVGIGKYACPVTVSDPDKSGFRQFFAHLATWDECHVGIGNTCTLAPREDSFSYYHVGGVLTSSGEVMPSGRITLAGGHADPHAGYRAALAHYDDTKSAVADVVAGSDEHGIWLAGAVLPSATPQDVYTLRATPLSGDWREVRGQLRLCAALAVNTPGFHVPRMRVGMKQGHQVSLAAAGAFRTSPAGQFAAGPQVDVAAEVRRVLAAQQRAASLAASIGRDPRSRVAALTAAVHGGGSA